jgi:Uma2 family endonuclease
MIGAAEYLEWERRQPDKHELHDGEVFAMAGGSPRHNLLSSAIAAELRAATRDRGCHVLSSDQLTDYLLVAQGQVRVEHYRREGDAWRYRVLVAGDTIVLANEARVAVDAVYDGVFELVPD